VAYRTIDFDVNDISDDEFWAKVDRSKYFDLIEDNAAAAILGMAEKLGMTKN
jgi:hypothetical protein